MTVKRTTKLAGVKVVRGEKMKTGKGWKLAVPPESPEGEVSEEI